MRYVLMLDTPLWIVLTIVLLVCIVKLRSRLAAAERLLDGIDNPVLLLPEKEQAQWAREQLAEQAFQRNAEAVSDFTLNRKYQA